MVSLLQRKEEVKEPLFATVDWTMQTELGRPRLSIPLTTCASKAISASATEALGHSLAWAGWHAP
jgi:hypothetical protein